MSIRTDLVRLIPAVIFLLMTAFILVLPMRPIYGQVDTGTIAGTVTDPSGAVLPGVSITVRNTDTNETLHAVTDDNGNYVTSPLKIGRYAIRASLPGFKTAVHEGVVLRVQQRALVDFRLDLGEVSEEVVVSGEAPLLESETSALGQVIENRTIMDLPLNGRNYLQLATLTTAVVPAMAGARGEGDFNANGNRSLQNNFLMDGIDNNNRIVDLQSGSSQVITPSIDAVQEFKVQTSQYSAEFGRAAGAVINLTIKSGTNELHGTAFEFLRNDALDAKNFFARAKPKLTFNQMGGTAGGPLRRDKTFLFGSWQGTRVRRGQTLPGTVPTLDMRRGIFSTTPRLRPVYDPLTTRRDTSGRIVRDPFPGGVIPPSRWDPVAARINDLWPAPNVPAQANTINVNYITHPVIRDRRDQYDARLDQLFSEKDKMFARVSFYNQSALQPGIFFPNVLDGSPNFEFSDRVDRARSLAASQTHIFSPRTVNEFRFGWNRVRDDRLPIVKEDLNEPLGLRGIPRLPGVTGLPRIVIARVTGIGGAPFTPNFKLSQAYQFSNNFSVIRGSHSMKAGVNVLVIQSNFGVSANARGNLTFDERFTACDDSTNNEMLGEGYADFLLGLVGGATLTSFVEGALRGRNYEFFFQDDWKTTPRLTVNWGVRYDLATPLFEKNNRQANFDLSTLTLKFAKAGLLFDRTLIRLDKNNVSPRLGLAYKVSDRLVLRSGYGIFVANYDSTGASGRLVANPPFFFNRNYNNNRLAPSFVLSEGFPTQGVEPAFNVQSWDEGLPLPYAQQWSLDLQYELTRNLLVEVGYTGNKGTKYIYNW